jgi:hypothetical protein
MSAWVSIKNQKGRRAKVFSAIIADIDKALRTKVYTNPQLKLPRHFYKYLLTFDQEATNIFPPLRGTGIDHKIELERKEDGIEPEVPWGPMYKMSRDKLLVLRKTLTELIDKGFIRVSNSSYPVYTETRRRASVLCRLLSTQSNYP